MLEIKKKKKYLMERLQAQQTEGKYRQLQEKIENETHGGIRRAKMMPSLI